MHEPYFSIIVPVFNTVKWLSRCIESVLTQYFSDYELILVDDGSNDGSSELCDEFAAQDNRIRCIHKLNAGVSSARNVGIDAARGRYVWFCDSDDTLCDNALAMIAKLTYSFSPLMVAFSIEQVDENDNRLGLIPAPKPSTSSAEGPLQCGDLLFPYAHVFQRRLIGDIRFDTTLSLLEDRDFFYKLFWKAAGSVMVIEKPLYRYFITREGSAVNSVCVSKSVAATRVQYEIYLNEKGLGHPMPAFEIFANHSIGVLFLISRNEGSRDEFECVRSRLFDQRAMVGNLRGPLRFKYMLAVYFPRLFHLLAVVTGAFKRNDLGSSVISDSRN